MGALTVGGYAKFFSTAGLAFRKMKEIALLAQ
jgi:hypothetical protein